MNMSGADMLSLLITKIVSNFIQGRCYLQRPTRQGEIGDKQKQLLSTRRGYLV